MTEKIALPTYFEIANGFESVFKGFTLEEVWSHPRLQPFRIKENREILVLELDRTVFFVKRYYGPGVGVFKYVLRGFRDRYGPENEWQKAHFLKKVGIRAAEPVAFGMERRCGIVRRALLVTLKMEGIRVEDLLRKKADLAFKTQVVEELAAFVGRFHTLGLSHQDFYLCHFFWSPDSRRISLLDLQRIRHFRGQRGQPRLRWIVKDLAQLDYSARNALGSDEYNHLTKTFVSAYKDYMPLIGESRTRRKIQSKVARISRHDRKLQAKASQEGV